MALVTSKMALLEFLLLTLSSQGLFACAPANCYPPSDPAEVVFKVADPENCHQYFYCLKDENGVFVISDMSYSCPDPETVFSFEDQQCGNYDCVECVGGVCTTYTCAPNQVYRPDETDCSSYYKCEDDTQMKCGGNAPFFDGNRCQSEERLCCTCKPFCTVDNLYKNIRDPIDCRNFYFCEMVDTFPEAKATCPSGSYFNYYEGVCDEEFPCLTKCKNVMGCDGCIDVFTCEATGYFPKCPGRCDQSYYHCRNEDVDKIVHAEKCGDQQVFEPEKGVCVSSGSCTFDPPEEC